MVERQTSTGPTAVFYLPVIVTTAQTRPIWVARRGQSQGDSIGLYRMQHIYGVALERSVLVEAHGEAEVSLSICAVGISHPPTAGSPLIRAAIVDRDYIGGCEGVFGVPTVIGYEVAPYLICLPSCSSRG